METRIADYIDFLGDLGEANAPYFLEGGQAVNFWAEYFCNKGAGEAIECFRPFTSKDCDLWVSYAALRYIESNALRGTLIKGTSPADGQIGIFTLQGERPLRIDLMSNVYGIPQDKIPKVLERAIIIGGISIIDPFPSSRADATACSASTRLGARTKNMSPCYANFCLNISAMRLKTPSPGSAPNVRSSTNSSS
jgi:hypothetical protein